MKANALQGIDNDLSFRIVHPCSKVAGLGTVIESDIVRPTKPVVSTSEIEPRRISHFRAYSQTANLSDVEVLRSEPNTEYALLNCEAGWKSPRKNDLLAVEHPCNCVRGPESTESPPAQPEKQKQRAASGLAIQEFVERGGFTECPTSQPTEHER